MRRWCSLCCPLILTLTSLGLWNEGIKVDVVKGPKTRVSTLFVWKTCAVYANTIWCNMTLQYCSEGFHSDWVFHFLRIRVGAPCSKNPKSPIIPMKCDVIMELCAQPKTWCLIKATLSNRCTYIIQFSSEFVSESSCCLASVPMISGQDPLRQRHLLLWWQSRPWSGPTSKITVGQSVDGWTNSDDFGAISPNELGSRLFFLPKMFPNSI